MDKNNLDNKVGLFDSWAFGKINYFLFVAGLALVIFGYIFTGSLKGASILGLGSIIPLFFYYFHERVWNKIKWGTND